MNGRIGSRFSFSSLACLNEKLPAMTSKTASGSKTKTIKIITHRTACSSIVCVTCSSYIIAAMYLSGPTSDSTFRTSVANGCLSSLSLATIFCWASFSLAIRFLSAFWETRKAFALLAPSSEVLRAIIWSTLSSNCLSTLRFASIVSFATRILSSIISNFDIASPVARLWSLCAFDRKPKMPNDVMNISTIIAHTK